MTTLDTPPPQVKQPKPAKVGRLEGFLLDFLATLVMVAFIVWAAGLGLDKGFGIHVPVIAGMLVTYAGLTLAKTAATAVGQTWHSARVKADAAFMGGMMAAQAHMAQEQAGGGIEDLLNALTKDTHTGGSPYL